MFVCITSPAGDRTIMHSAQYASSWGMVLLTWLLFMVTVHANCECGYAVNNTKAESHQVFTDLLETNFLTLRDVSYNTDWKIQKYYTNPKPTYGRNATAANVVSNPVADNSTLDGPSKLGGVAGLQLWVRGGIPADGYVPSGEIKSVRTDMLYGSIRVAARMTPVNGTCSAMFTYYNNTQEIDIELLSRQYENYTKSGVSIMNLVLHSIDSLNAGYQKPNTSTYGRPELPVDLTDAFHEYRIDWVPGRASFYLDGHWFWDLVGENVPIMPSALLLSHWSNGAPGWSQGPPVEDAVMTVSYVKAYFNSSEPQRSRDYEKRCVDPTVETAICVVPDQEGPPQVISVAVNGTIETVGSANTFFFSEQSNQTVNQTVFTGRSLGTQTSASGTTTWLISTLILAHILVLL